MIAHPATINRRVLIVDDSPSIHGDFAKILKPATAQDTSLGETESLLFGTPSHTTVSAKERFELDSAYQGREALALVEAALAAGRPYAMAFIDMRMPPGWDGLETIERLWQVDPRLQVALCTAYTDYSWEEIDQRLPSSDRLLILKKPFDAIEIRQMASALTVKWQMTEDAALKMNLLARTDGLTGLVNRATLIERLHQAFAAARRGAAPFAVFYLDLDHFKRINDTLGHPVGDLLLQQVAQRIRSGVRENDVVARLGGDEFAILQLDVSDPTQSATVAAKIRDALAEPYHLTGNAVHISVSIGICIYRPTSLDADSLLAGADMALYRAKETGRNQYQFHSEEITREVAERLILAEELTTALTRGGLKLDYTPEVDLHSGKILGMAAQVSWQHPRLGLLPASAFVPAAEKTGAIIPLGRWILDHACWQMRHWQNEGVAPPVMAIKISLAQLKTGPELIYDVLRIAARWELAPWDLRFDVTEATLAQTKWTHNDALPRLRELGVTIAIDDFGTEYSSFDWLQTYRVNHLKLTQSLIDHAAQDEAGANRLRAIVNFARDLAIDISAEGTLPADQDAALTSGPPLNNVQGLCPREAVSPEQAARLLKDASVAAPLPREDEG
ncbi:putative bifunctional diguanylate cyclase/phosphodiesterase [Pseudomonas moraviensis]|uniref:Diguanylate cyclase (GGDEF)-like protein n=1 Tax=Pseudomonas moraviensis TaxID=321662 RepID=A0A7Y9VYB6_9PSED|nr:diguanylate cyclase [Pseudomonas moraviensis]NYH10148.1 diguanylate cyclase (GGDEF)-like protein [Pseudomonas moraviensis]